MPSPRTTVSGVLQFVLGEVWVAIRVYGVVSDMQKGHACYVNGIPHLYRSKHPFGHAVGLWAKVADDEKSPRLMGLGLSPEGETLENIEKDTLVKDYNKSPVQLSMLSTKLRKMFIDHLIQNKSTEYHLATGFHKITHAEFKSIGGGEICMPHAFCINRIKQLCDATLEGAKKLMILWSRIPHVEMFTDDKKEKPLNEGAIDPTDDEIIERLAYITCMPLEQFKQLPPQEILRLKKQYLPNL